MSELIVVHEDLGSARVVHVFDDIDIANSAQLADEIECAGDGAPLVVELSRCPYLDASGLRVLVRAMNRYGTNLRVVVEPESTVERVLQLADLHRPLVSFSSLASALEAR